MKRLLVWAGLGALAALLLTTVINLNCDSFAEIASGCTRLNVGPMMLIGAVVGVVVGLFTGARRRVREERDRPPPRLPPKT